RLGSARLGSVPALPPEGESGGAFRARDFRKRVAVFDARRPRVVSPIGSARSFARVRPGRPSFATCGHFAHSSNSSGMGIENRPAQERPVQLLGKSSEISVGIRSFPDPTCGSERKAHNFVR
ncbi:MAG: hypothetical protein CL933_12625, partial [Deltaproteobacteria bacterium]|nr:hypothetical protein [Deltaproteobacteria bacterium]